MNQFILTLFFLDRFLPGLMDLCIEVRALNDEAPVGEDLLERLLR